MFGLLKRRSLDRAVLNSRIESVEFVVLDTELTGLDLKRDSIVSIGAIKMKGSRVLLGDVFYRVVAPESHGIRAVVVHEITPQETDTCPELRTILPELLYFIGKRPVVGHHIGLDIAFLNRALKASGRRPLDNPAIDTYRLYTYLKKKRLQADAFFEFAGDSLSLFEIAQSYDIPVHNVHHALYDAFVAAQLFQRFIHELDEMGLKTLRDLLLISSHERR